MFKEPSYEQKMAKLHLEVTCAYEGLKQTQERIGRISLSEPSYIFDVRKVEIEMLLTAAAQLKILGKELADKAEKVMSQLNHSHYFIFDADHAKGYIYRHEENDKQWQAKQEEFCPKEEKEPPDIGACVGALSPEELEELMKEGDTLIANGGKPNDVC